MSIAQVNDKDIYSLLGYAIVHAQAVESSVRFCTTFVLQKKGGPMTYDKLQILKEEEKAKALGYYFSQIRFRSSLHPALQTALDEYQQMRNDLVHNHSEIPGWDMDSPEGIEFCKRHIGTFISKGQKLLEVFTALTMEWQDQTGFHIEESETSEKYFGQVKARYGPFIQNLFGYQQPNDEP